MQKENLTIKEAAECMGVTPQCLGRRLSNDSSIPRIELHLGEQNRYLIPRKRFLEWLEADTKKSETALKKRSERMQRLS